MAEWTIDLECLAAEIVGTHKAFSNKLIQLNDLGSIKVDLCFADDQIRLLDKMREAALHSEAGSNDQVLAISLMTSAIITYVRATKSGSKHRKRFDLIPKFSQPEKSRHKALCELRDGALAHYGPGLGEGKTPLHQDGVFAFFDDEKGALQVNLICRRTVIDLSLVDMIKIQIQAAILIVERQIHSLRDEVLTELSTQLASNEISIAVFVSAQRSLEDFFGDEEAQRKVLAGPRVGHQKGMIARRTS